LPTRTASKTKSPILPEKLDSAEVLTQHLEALFKIDPRLADLYKRAGTFEVRATPGGFTGLARVICGQQLSVASARAIYGRFSALAGADTAEGYLRLDEAKVLGTGFSRSKFKTVRNVARAVVAGELDFTALEVMPAEEAVAALTRIGGIGPWTAEIYLMFCSGHPDVFPAGDLALQVGVAKAFGIGDRIAPKPLAEMARQWAPYRHAAALLFWRYYAALRRREGIAL
jgi:DNA-3-methyladenine glycosylase II